MAFRKMVPIVLAAGAASRMGRPKEWLQFGALTCVDLILQACAQAELARPVVVTRAERAEQLKGHAERRGYAIDVVINPRPELGQLSSLAAGLVHASGRDMAAFLIYPVDHPLVTGADIVLLCRAMVESPLHPTVVTPSFARRRGHPVVVDAALSRHLLALPAGASPRPVLLGEASRTVYVDLDDDRALTDMDTPEDYERCVRRYLSGC